MRYVEQGINKDLVDFIRFLVTAIYMEFELAQKFNDLINKEYHSTDNMKQLCRTIVSEGCVLLKNDGVLPIKDAKIALFGRCQINTFYVGYGSGGDVKPSYKVSILEGLLNNNANINKKVMDAYIDWTNENIIDHGSWGCWPLCYEEMEVSDSMVLQASNESDVAVVVIGRSAGEDRDILLDKGSWYLNDKEINLLTTVRKYFKKLCIVFNGGSIMDMSQLLSFSPNALLLAWQGGQETGNGIADVLLGLTSPSGKLTDTIANIEDYPSTKYFGHPEYNTYVEDIYVGYRYFNTFKKESIIYPFGYGLTYSDFKVTVLEYNFSDNIINVKFKVKNIGNFKAKEVVQFYLSKPKGLLGNPNVELVKYVKTKELEVGEEEHFDLNIDISLIASYDDTGITNHKNCFILEKGLYHLFIGFDSLNFECDLEFNLNEVWYKQTVEACAPNNSFKRLVNKTNLYEEVPVGTTDIKSRILARMPKNNEINTNYYTYEQLKNNEITIDEFIDSLDFEELEALTRGSLYSMDSPLGPLGNAGTLAASNEKLFKRGVPAVSTNDGPSGVRLACNSTLLPNGVLLASTFNDELIEKICYEVGLEGEVRKSHIMLAPGINIHRNPLCGRNFEYFSEDPYLTGKMASAYVKGIQKAKMSACPKHFACNSQEYNRHINNSILSQRALREIYLRGFEICVNEANPKVIMTSYNKVNGEYAYYNYDLVNIILREEMGFKGLVITDWWMRHDESKLFKNLKTQSYRVRATVDVYMPGSTGDKNNPGQSDGTLLESYENNGITLAEIRYCAKNVIKFCLENL